MYCPRIHSILIRRRKCNASFYYTIISLDQKNYEQNKHGMNKKPPKGEYSMSYSLHGVLTEVID